MPDKHFWNQRYDVDEYVYGTEPNSFLAEHVAWLSGPVLSLAEGEGRNAVFLASRGLEVHAVDSSEVGLEKARRLAQSEGTEIKTILADLGDFEPEPDRYASVVSIFAHVPSHIRARLYPLVAKSLKPGGVIILESYAEGQLARNTGGPKDLDRLLSKDAIEMEFADYEPILLREIDREVNEGRFHNGLASVVQFVGRKRVAGD